MSKSKVLFMMTGSIACYKACQVVSRLVQAGCEVQVVMTPAALKFVGNATLEGLTGKPVVSDMYTQGNVMDHIHLMRWADLILVAPATANFINKTAQGIGDDLVSTLFLGDEYFNVPSSGDSKVVNVFEILRRRDFGFCIRNFGLWRRRLR
jgi:phosphopantothenoylcysteine decarboxylase/phosphopantothenate--cysteine ligase